MILFEQLKNIPKVDLHINLTSSISTDLVYELNEFDNIILFIDELHTLVGAGASEGSMDASNLLKPALARGELRAIGATTLNEYKKYIEKDSALELFVPANFATVWKITL